MKDFKGRISSGSDKEHQRDLEWQRLLRNIGFNNRVQISKIPKECDAFHTGTLQEATEFACSMSKLVAREPQCVRNESSSLQSSLLIHPHHPLHIGTYNHQCHALFYYHHSAHLSLHSPNSIQMNPRTRAADVFFAANTSQVFCPPKISSQS